MTMIETQTEIINVQFHYEDGSWWADSTDMPSLFAGDDDLAEARRLVQEVVRNVYGEGASVVFWMPPPTGFVSLVYSGGGGKVQGGQESWPSPSPGEFTDMSPRRVSATSSA